MALLSNTTTPYVMWLGALSAICGLVILKSKQDSKVVTTGTWIGAGGGDERALIVWLHVTVSLVTNFTAVFRRMPPPFPV